MEELPDSVRKEARTFELGVGVSSQFSKPIVARWRTRLEEELKSAHSEDDGIARIESLKAEYLATEMRPKQYRSLLGLWGGTFVAGGLLVYFLFGEHSVCKNLSTAFCSEFYGHFFGYIAFRYAMYGVLIGFALRISFDEARTSFGKERTVLSRPALSLMLGSVLAYVLARLVAEGKLSLNLFGIVLGRTETASGPVFQDSAALLLIGLLAGIASDVLLEKIISNARSAAEEAFHHE